MPIPKYEDIIKLIKAGATIEAQEKIIELREGAMELQEENLALRQRVSLLELDLQQRKNTRHEKSLYWMGDDPVPFCPRCYENSNKLVHLFGPLRGNSLAGMTMVGYECHICHHDYISTENEPFQPELNWARHSNAIRKLS